MRFFRPLIYHFHFKFYQVKKYHPDVSPTSEEFYLKIQQAYDIQSDSGLRRQYDLAQGIDNPSWDEVEYLFTDFNEEQKPLYTELSEEIDIKREKEMQER